jgi:hypothetical protein
VENEKKLFEKKEATHAPITRTTSEWRAIEREFKENGGAQAWGRLRELNVDEIADKNERGFRCRCGGYVQYRTAVGVVLGRERGSNSKYRMDWQSNFVCRNCAMEFASAYGLDWVEG